MLNQPGPDTHLLPRAAWPVVLRVLSACLPAWQIIKNRDWLVSLAVRCVEHEVNLARAVGAGPPHLRRSSSSMSGACVSHACTTTRTAPSSEWLRFEVPPP